MTQPTSIPRALLVHAAVYVAAALGLLAKAQPVNWNTPPNLEYEMGWGFYLVVIGIIAGLLGPLEGGFLGRGHRIPGWLLATAAAGLGVMGSGFFTDPPPAYGDEVWTSSSGDVIMSQGLWFAYWIVHTAIAMTALALLRRHSDTRVRTNGAVSA